MQQWTLTNEKTGPTRVTVAVDDLPVRVTVCPEASRVTATVRASGEYLVALAPNPSGVTVAASTKSRADSWMRRVLEQSLATAGKAPVEADLGVVLQVPAESALVVAGSGDVHLRGGDRLVETHFTATGKIIQEGEG